jgi:signal transduction histidine kinase
LALRAGVPGRATERRLVIRNPVGEGSLGLAYAPIGIGGDGVVAAGSRHCEFPSEAQSLLLRTAANEATVALQRWRADADKHRFVSMVKRSSDFIGIAGLDGRPIFINPAGYALVGLSADQDISRLHFLDFVAPRDQPLVRDYCWPDVLQNGRWQGEILFRHFVTEEPIPFMVDAFRINDPRNRELMNIATVSRDLRSQKAAEVELRGLTESLERRVADRTSELADAHAQLVAEMRRRGQADIRLRQSQAELSHAGRLSTAGQMAAAMAHELNQPLTAVTSSANAARRLLIRGRPDDIATLQTIMDEIATHTVRAAQILRRLRDFVSRGVVEKRVENAVSLIEEAMSFTVAGSRAHDVAVTFSFDPAAATVFANRIQVQQVLVNLMHNAFEAMAVSTRRQLHVTTLRIDRETVEFALADTGPGLLGEAAHRLFEPFFSTKNDGMGLGLSLCRSIVEAHGGRLRNEVNPRGGTIFKFTLASPLESRADHGG